LRRDLVRNGVKFIGNRYQWDTIAKMMETFFLEKYEK